MGMMEIFRKNLREEVKKVGGIKAFAERMGYSRSGFALILNGDRDIREEHLELIEKILNKPIYQLFLESEELKKLQERREKMVEYHEMIDLMEKVPEIRQAVIGQVAVLKKTFSFEIEKAKKKAHLPLSSK